MHMAKAKKIIPALAYRLGRIRQYIAHPLSKWERVYSTENPWHLDHPGDVYRFEETNRIIRESIGPVEAILEIGSGEGHQTEWLLNLAHKVRGLDISATAVRRSRCKFANNPNATFSVGRLPDIRTDERFDLVTAFELIYYVNPKDIPRIFDVMDRIGHKRIVSVFWPQRHLLDNHLFPTRSAARQIIYWENEPRWLAAWW
jgi:2-polyprenyl-3-methyl-5-hydroxy-6-metoxy-1,4-benzoquinol methylase